MKSLGHPNMQAHILIVEDEIAIRDMVVLALERHGFSVHSAATVNEARTHLSSQSINQPSNQSVNLVIVDWMLPGGSGLEFVRWLRAQELYRNLPIVMLTAKTEEHDITTGLDAGADDYMTKPFSPRELHSRIKALLRRSADFNTTHQHTCGPLTLDLQTHQLTVMDQEVSLGHTEFKLLAFLIQSPGRVYSRAQLLDNVWGPGTYIEERTVDVHILRLRKCLKAHAADGLIETVRGTGYRLQAT